jgi:asparagine synthase (glutamine-hydrolysing)
MMKKLKHRAPDGSDVYQAGNIALGHCHFWTTPEEMGEKQPLTVDGLPFRIVLDGRLDNRAELFDALDIHHADGKRMSDAALILHAYARWGAQCFEHLLGEYALVIFDKKKNEITCARDSIGERTLFYKINSARLIVASEPWAAASAMGETPELNEHAVAYHFALRAPEDGQTWFKDVYELLPAHWMQVSADKMRLARYWQPDPNLIEKRVKKSDAEYAEEFRAVLQESVRCRMRAPTPIGVLMSGGLDSTSVAGLAAQMLAPQRLTTISYVFDDLKECDEREYIHAIKEKWNLRSLEIPCDDAWTFKNWQNWKRNPNHPEGNLYRLLKERAYGRAHEEGLRVLMTGNNGDPLYSPGNEWLADMLLEGRLLDAIRETQFNIKAKGIRKNLSSGYLRRAARILLDKVPGFKHIHRPPTLPEWITPFSASQIQKPALKIHPAFSRHSHLMGAWAAQDAPREAFSASQHALEMRAPYRDRRLIEFVLALPAYQLYAKGRYKQILRAAMQGILPDLVRDRMTRTSLTPLYLRGIKREQHVFMDYFQTPTPAWQRFISKDWLVTKRGSSASYMDMDGTESVIRWLCISYEAWIQASGSIND